MRLAQNLHSGMMGNVTKFHHEPFYFWILVTGAHHTEGLQKNLNFKIPLAMAKKILSTALATTG